MEKLKGADDVDIGSVAEAAAKKYAKTKLK